MYFFTLIFSCFFIYWELLSIIHQRHLRHLPLLTTEFHRISCLEMSLSNVCDTHTFLQFEKYKSEKEEIHLSFEFPWLNPAESRIFNVFLDHNSITERTQPTGRSRHSCVAIPSKARIGREQSCKCVHNVSVPDRYFQSSVLPYSGPHETLDRVERSRIDSRWSDLNARYRFIQRS